MELFAADGHDAGGCERVTGKSGMRPEREGSHPEQGPVKPPSAHEHVPARPATHTPKADPTERGLQR